MKSMKCRMIAMLMVTVMLLSQVSVSVSAATVSNETGTEEKTMSTVSGTEITSDDTVEVNADKNAEKAEFEESERGDIISVNTGMGSYDVCENPEEGEEGFEMDGSYTIQIPEKNPFFPYEVQFTHKGVVTTEWFMTPDSTIAIGGHVFKVNADFDGSEITQMSLNVAGQEVVIYPERKNFSDNVLEEESLLPLQPGTGLQPLDLTGFTPVELTNVSMASAFAGQDAITDTSKIAWTYYEYYGEYTVSMLGDHIDLSYPADSNSSAYWTVIAGDDQLNGNNKKYSVEVSYSNIRNWLEPIAYRQTENGERTNVGISSSEYTIKQLSYGYNKTYGTEEVTLRSDNLQDIYFSFRINESIEKNKKYDYIKVYEGRYNSAQEAMAGKDITSQILNVDMTQRDAGYLYQYQGDYPKFTAVTFDAGGNPTGCQYFDVNLYCTGTNTSRPLTGLSLSLDTNIESSIRSTNYATMPDGVEQCTYVLEKGVPVNGTYNLKMSYYQEGNRADDKVTAAYVGNYASLAEAQAAGAKDIKTTLFGDAGYPADYSQGIYFSVFVGEESIYRYLVKTEEYLYSYISLSFTGVVDRNGNEMGCYQVPSDSYGDGHYRALLVTPDTDVTHLAPVFSSYYNSRLYTAGSSTPETSGKSYHDFSKEPVHYTVSSEDGSDREEIWLSVIKAVIGRGQLYFSSTADEESNTRIEDGVIYSEREIILDDLGSYHDIFVMNTGTEALPAMSVEIDSDVLRLDDYWDFKGQYELAGVDIEHLGNYSYTKNISKLRLRVKDGVVSGTEITGTLTIKSNGTTLAVLTLKGMAGAPRITTEDISAAVKYVPYGTMIQSSNKYSRNTVTFEQTLGDLPEGMELRENGEIYGVPKETGEFVFSVRMNNSLFSSSDTANFTLIVNDNTDPNVDGATDEGYTVLQRIPNLTMDDPNSYTFVSEGVYTEYKAVYLDGEKLVEGVDYTSESGSTRITLRSQTLVSSNTEGAHTIGVEFRSTSDDSLKRAAQNYRIIPGSINDRVGGGAAGSGSSINMAPIRYTVKSGDTLWKIARQFYGNGAMWTKIYADNKSTIKNPNRIYVGQVLLIYPSIGDGTYITESGAKTYKVKRGDTLWSIAEEMYGKGKRWKKIYEANKGTLSDPNKLYAGQILIIPN